MLRSSMIVTVLSALGVACSSELAAPTAAHRAGTAGPESSKPIPDVNAAVVDITIFGTGRTTEWTEISVSGQRKWTSSSINGATVDVPIGIPRDTIFQLFLDGAPELGTRVIADQSVEVMLFGGQPALVHKEGDENGFTAGTPQLMMFIWPGRLPAPAREISQGGPAVLTITEFVAPSPNTSDGVLRGRLEFIGEEWVREWNKDGTATLRKSGAKVSVNAELRLTWEHRTRAVP